MELDHRHDRPLVLANVVLRAWLGEPDGFADNLQEVQGDTRICAQLVKGRAAESCEPIEGAGIQEGERQSSGPDGLGHSVERHAALLQAVHPTRPAHVTRRERVSRARPQDPELDQSVDVVDVDPGPPGHLLARVLAHGKTIVA